jgi:hypothetical protein
MALKAETKTKLKAFGLDVDKLIAAVIADAETDYEVPEVTVFKTEELETRDNNKISEGKKLGEKEGETRGKELAAKALKKKFAIEDEATKDIDKVVDMVNAKVGAGDAGLKEQVALLLKDKEMLTVKVSEVEKQAKAASFDAQLISMFPATRTADLRDSERLALAKMDLSFEEVEGKQVVKRNGEILRDKTTQNPIAVNTAITDYFAERKWAAAPGSGGRGGVDNPPGGGGTGGARKRSQVEEQWLKDNPGGNPISPEFQKYMETAAKDIPDFDYYN